MNKIWKKFLSNLCLSTLIITPFTTSATPVATTTTTNSVQSPAVKPQINTAMYKAYADFMQKKGGPFIKFVGAVAADLDGDKVDDLVIFETDEARGDFRIGFATYKNGKLIPAGGTSSGSFNSGSNFTVSLVSNKAKTDFAIKLVSMPTNPKNTKTVEYLKLKNNAYSPYLSYGNFSPYPKTVQLKEGKVISLAEYNKLANQYTEATTLVTLAENTFVPVDYTKKGQAIIDLSKGIVSNTGTPYELIGKGIIDTIPYHVGDPIEKATSVLGQGITDTMQAIRFHIYDGYTINESIYSPVITGYFLHKGFKFYGITLGDDVKTIEAKLGKNFTKYQVGEGDELAPAAAIYSYTYSNNNNFLSIYFDASNKSISADFISKNY